MKNEVHKIEVLLDSIHNKNVIRTLKQAFTLGFNKSLSTRSQAKSNTKQNNQEYDSSGKFTESIVI